MADLLSTTQDAAAIALKADSGVSGIVSARVYNVEAPSTPTWPWALVGSAVETASYEDCHDAATMSLTVHGFARGPGQVAVASLGNAIKRALHGKVISRNGLRIDFSHEQTQIIRDSAEASAYHAICRFTVDCRGEKPI